MDTTKQNQAPGGQDSSDDLIAELARLVAKDARTTSSNSAVYEQRVEPSFGAAPEPAPEQNTDPEPPAPAAEPEWGAPEPVADAYEPEAPSRNDGSDMFDFGFASEPKAAQPEPNYQPEAGGDDFDPIAELIANAAQDEMAADSDADRASDAPEEDRLFATPSQPSASTVRYWDEPNIAQASTDASAAQDDDLSYDDDRWSPPSYSAERETPRPAPQTDDRDPLSEIEALIGEAARVSDEGGVSGRRVKSSFLDDTQTRTPQQAPRQHDDEAVDAAEAAILAAAAATGAQTRRVQAVEAEVRDTGTGNRSIPDPLFAATPVAPSREPLSEPSAEAYGEDDYLEEEEYVQPVRRRRAGFLLPAAAGAVLFALIGGTYFMFFSAPTDPGEAPVLTADAGAFKEDAPETVSDDAASQSVVFNELGGNASDQDGETLVSRDQTGGVTGDDVSSIISAPEGEMTLANRPVRTVTVRPDGTIVNAEDSVAGSNVLPVDRPDVPTVSNSVTASDPIGEAIALAMGEEAAAGGSSFETAATTAPATQATGTLQAPATSEPTSDGSAATAPTPIPRPAETGTLQTPASDTAPATATSDVAAVQSPAEPTPAAAPVDTSNVGAWVQLSSQRSEEVARAGIPSLQSQFGSLFNGATLDVSRVDLGERGIYYRVRLPQPTFEAATSVCNAIRAQSGDCFVLNN